MNILTHLAYSDKCYFHFSIGCLIELKFYEVSRNSVSNICWKFLLSFLKNKKVLFLKKIFLKPLSISKPKSFVSIRIDKCPLSAARWRGVTEELFWGLLSLSCAKIRFLPTDMNITALIFRICNLQASKCPFTAARWSRVQADCCDFK